MKLIKFVFLLAFFLFLGCKSRDLLNDGNQKKTTFKIKTITSEFSREKMYSTYLPSGYEKNKMYPHDDRIYVEYRVTYTDGRTFYLSNDIWNGSRVNVENLYRIGINGYVKKTWSDTTYYSGIQEDGKNWADYQLGEIVVGYANVPNEKKSEFENAIRTIKSIK